MKRWKVLFVGIGSIAKRHIKNLAVFMAQRKEEIQIDAYRTKNRDILLIISDSYHVIEQVPDDYDVIFVTNPTQLHLETIELFHEKGKHFFIEKSLCTLEQISFAKFPMRDDSVYYVAAPLRYNAVINYIKKNVCPEVVLSIRCICSSYLPDWRPGIDYRETYSANKKLGGGVSIDLIHEWDYIMYLFGMPINIKTFIRHISDLEFDSDDIAIYIADFGYMLAEVHVDYIGRSPVRILEIFTKEDTIQCDLIESTVTYKKSGEKISFRQIRDEYQLEELKYFWSLIDERKYGRKNIECAVKVLMIAGGLI